MRARCCGVRLTSCAQSILCAYFALLGAITDRNINDARARARSLYTTPVSPLRPPVVGLAVCGLASERGEADGRPSARSDPTPIGWG